MRRNVRWILVGLVVIVGLGASSLWMASSQLLFPSWRGAGGRLDACSAELAAHWGPSCGNLRETRALRFAEVQVPSLNGYPLPGWLLRAEENGHGPARGAVLLVHGGGSDRRELVRHAPWFLARRLDVLAVDLSCHGEAPCEVPGLSYGARESRDVVGAYLFLLKEHATVYAMGSSVGAAAILIALPEMPRLAGAIAENPPLSFERLIRDAPQSKALPRAMVNALIGLTKLRGKFDGLTTAEHSLRLAAATPVFFIHSQRDSVAPHQHSELLARAYEGPKTTWFPDVGDHGAVWEAAPQEYEERLATFLGAAGGG